MSKLWWLGLLVFALLTVSIGCSNDDDNGGTNSTNQAPVIDSITCDNDSLIEGHLVTVAAWVTDPESENVTYSWSCPEGGIDFVTPVSNSYMITTCCTVTGEMFRWIVVAASDPHNATARDSLRLRLVPAP